MAKARPTKVKKAEWRGYHKINLNTEQREDFESNHLPQEVAWSEFDILINNGYKFSLNWDDYNSGVSASLYCRDAKMDWAGYTLSAWAGDVETAIKLLLYKHYVVCSQRWEIAPPEREGVSSEWG